MTIEQLQVVLLKINSIANRQWPHDAVRLCLYILENWEDIHIPEVLENAFSILVYRR